MSGYNIEYFLKDFADRTMANLKNIEEQIECGFGRNEVYETTQLINSLLGLIIIPVEAAKRTYKQKNKKSNSEKEVTEVEKLRENDNNLKEVSSEDYSELIELLEKCQKEKRLFSDYKEDNEKIYISSFITHIRNALAHGGNRGIHFYPITEGGKITEIIFYDNKKEKGKRMFYEFCVKLTINELRNMVENVSNLYCRFEERNYPISEKQKRYEDDIEKLKNLMQNGRKDKHTVVCNVQRDDET